MKNLKLIVLSLFFASLFFVSCEKDEEDDDLIEVNSTEVLVKYLEQDDFVNTYMPAMIGASDVKTANTAGSAFIIDIRQPDAYASGHIENAVNMTMAEAVAYAQTEDLSSYDKVVIVCYTGQSASYTTSMIRLLGYDNVFCMKFGMSSWHSDFAGSMQNNLANTYATQLVTEAADKNAEGELPELSVTATDGAEILVERADAVIGEWGDAKISADIVFANPDDYYIVNYWKPAHYELGHIPGAVQYTPKESMKLGADLKTLPTDKPVVVYCYTGQTSAHLAAFLRTIGYDAKTLLSGINGMAYDWAVGHEMTHWDDAYIMEYDYVTK